MGNEYLGDPSALPSGLTPDGWFSSGDLGVQVGEDAYTYVCRLEEVLRLSGFLVHPGEIEERLSCHPAVELQRCRCPPESLTPRSPTCV